MKRVKKILANIWVISIVSPIITAIIISVFTALIKQINFFEAFKLLLSWIFRIFTFRIPLYVFVLIILFIIFIYLYVKIEETKESNLPNWLNYTKEHYKSWIFKWEYSLGYNKYEIKNLRPICRCGCELSIKDEYKNKWYSRGILVCPNCGNTYPTLDRDTLDDFQKILIHSINMGDYPEMPKNSRDSDSR